MKNDAQVLIENAERITPPRKKKGEPKAPQIAYEKTIEELLPFLLPFCEC